MKHTKRFSIGIILFLIMIFGFSLTGVDILTRQTYNAAGENSADSSEFFDDVIDEKVYRGAVGTQDEVAPSGFTSIWKYTDFYENISTIGGVQVATYLYVHGVNYSDVSLNTVAKVKFAMKASDKINFNFVASNESHDWLIFTLIQVEKHKWSLTIENINGVVVYDSHNDITLENGLLEGAYNSNDAYADNALNAILFGNPKGYGAQAPVGTTPCVYVTEVRGIKKKHESGGDIIDEALYNSKSIELTVSEENAPIGYTNVWEYTATAGTSYIRGDQYSETVLDNMRSVNFAIKTNGQLILDNANLTDYDGQWLYFNLMQTDKALWTIVVQDSYYDIIHTVNNASGVINSPYYVDNSLQAILFGVSGYYPLASEDTNVTVYVTEVRGILRRTPFPLTTVVADDSFIRTAHENEDKYLLPSGFESVYKIDFNETYLHGGIHYSNKSLTDYEEIYFAIRNDKYVKLGSTGTMAQKGWLYFSLVQNENGKWSITVKNERNEVLHIERSVDGTACNDFYTQDGISTLLYLSSNSFYPIKSAFGSFYFTEVRGVKKKSLTHNLLDYQVVCPSATVIGSGRAVRAANEYVKFVSEATGNQTYWIRENAFIGNGKKYISIGETSLLAEANLGADEEDIAKLGDSGYIIKTDTLENIYIIGGDIENGWLGLLSGVYDILHDYFGYEYYADGVYSLNKGMTEAMFDISDMNCMVIPSFKYRLRTYGFNSANSTDKEFNGYRLRMNSLKAYSFDPMGYDMHDLVYALPYSEYGASHSDWYMAGYNGTTKRQFCFGRDTDGMAQIIVEKMLPIVSDAEASDSELVGMDKFFYVGMYDCREWCECSACTAYINSHGGYKVSTYILLMNKIASLLKNCGRTDIKPVMLAYHGTQNAPVKENFDGTFSLFSEDLRLNENVIVYYCPIEANYYVSFDYLGDAARSDGTPSVKERNALALKNLKGWGSVAKNVMYYFYMEHFPDHYMEFFDIFGSIQDNFRCAAENGGISMYNLGQFNESVSSGFSRLKEYVNAKLMWNVNENLDELIDGFFVNYYGVASGRIRKIFDEYRSMIAEKFKNHPEYGDMSQYSLRQLPSDWFDAEKLRTWLYDIETAYVEVGNAYNAGKITQSERERLNKTIKLESMSLRAIVIEYFSTQITYISNGKSLVEMKNEWKSDASELGMTMWAEHETLEEHYEKWEN